MFSYFPIKLSQHNLILPFLWWDIARNKKISTSLDVTFEYLRSICLLIRDQIFSNIKLSKSAVLIMFWVLKTWKLYFLPYFLFGSQLLNRIIFVSTSSFLVEFPSINNKLSNWIYIIFVNEMMTQNHLPRKSYFAFPFMILSANYFPIKSHSYAVHEVFFASYLDHDAGFSQKRQWNSRGNFDALQQCNGNEFVA